jgi:small conductance mechanosensitive channel
MPVKTLVIDLAVRYGFQVLGALVVLFIGALIARWLGRLTDRRLERQRMEPPMRLLIVRTLRIVVMLFAVVVAMDKFGFQIAPLVAGIGVAGLGVGIALQGVLGNVMAGLTIIFSKPFRVGEHVAVAGVHGDVAAIDLMSTTLVHADRSRVIVPNRKIVGEIVHNFGTTRQLTLAVAVPLDANLGAVLTTARDAILANPRVLKDPSPSIGVVQVGEAGIKIGIQPWVSVADVSVAEGELYRSLVERFHAQGIGAPLPRHEVRLVNGGRLA